MTESLPSPALIPKPCGVAQFHLVQLVGALGLHSASGGAPLVVTVPSNLETVEGQ